MANTAPAFSGTSQSAANTIKLGTSDSALQVLALANGKILVAGRIDNAGYVARYLADGTLDPEFGSAGIFKTVIGISTSLYSLTLQADGKIIATGSAGFVDSTAEMVTLRLTAEGKVDASFGKDGTVLSVLTDQTYGAGASLLPDGRIIGMAYTTNDDWSASTSTLLCFTSDGTPSPFFAGQSSYKIPSSTSATSFGALVQADGSILLVGDGYGSTSEMDFSISRLNSNGTVDTQFDPLSQGHSLFREQMYFSDAILQSDGKVLALGSVTRNLPNVQDLVLVRFDGNHLDTTFGGTGRITLDVGAYDQCNSLTALPDGKFLVVLSTGNKSAQDVGLLRFLSDGRLDASFGNSGIVKMDFGSIDSGVDVTVQNDGKIVVVGYSGRTNVQHTVIARFNPDGSTDTIFGTTSSNTAHPTFLEGDRIVRLESTLTISDVDMPLNYTGATLTLSRSTPNSEDYFGSVIGTLSDLIEGQPLKFDDVTIGLVISNKNGLLSMSFNDNATVERVNLLLHCIGYGNASEAPPTSIDLQWVFNDGNTGAQGSGGALSATATTTVILKGVNDAPTAHSGDVSILSGLDYYLKVSDFAFADAEDGSNMGSVRIDTLPATGTLTYMGKAVTAGQIVPAAQFASASFHFTSNGDKSHPASMTFTVFDSEGLASTAGHTLTFYPYQATLKGSAANDTIEGTQYKEIITGGDGNDTINGGGGTDTAVFAGLRANYTVNAHDGVVTVNNTAGTEGMDTLTNVERLHFNDMNMAFDVDGVGGQAYRLYQAAFDRVPDVGGLGFWIDLMDKGMTRQEAAKYFVTSPEFQNLYGAAPTNDQIVTKFYNNVLHRAPEASGYAFWMNLLDTHQVSTSDALVFFSESPENQAALVGVITAGVNYLSVT